MSFELKKDKALFLKSSADYSTQQNIDLEVNLPDYCSDIKRILKCIMTPNISAFSFTGDKINITGSVVIRLIYINEKDKLDCFEGQKDFSCVIKTDKIPADSSITLKAKTNYTNCRATSQRRLSISGNIGICANAFYIEEKSLPNSATGAGTETKSTSHKHSSIIAQREKTFDLSETASLGEDKAAVGKILLVNSFAVIDSKKAVSDKLLIKGELYTDILYLADRQDNTFCRFRHSMPISQIIDLPGIDENSVCDVSCDVRQILVGVKEDTSSQNRLLEIAAKVSAFVKCTKQTEITVLTDCYSVSHKIKEEYAIEEFLCPIHTMDRQKTIRHTLDLPGSSIKQICDIWQNDITFDMKGKDDKVAASCSITLGILYLDTNNCPEYTEKSLEFSFEEKLPSSYEFIKCEFIPTIRHIDFKLKGKDKIDISIECGILANIFSAKSSRLITGIEVEGEKEKKHCPALTVYFCSKGESVWDIARRYNTTSSLICNENGIEDEIPEGIRTLLIPSV